MIRMLEKAEPKEPGLIPNDEFKRRSTIFFQKHGNNLAEYNKKIHENKISWGTLVELNAEKYADNIAIKFEDITFTYKEFNEWVNRYAHF